MAVLKYKNANGEYIPIPAGIPSNVSTFVNDANYQNEEQVRAIVAAGGGGGGVSMEEVEAAITEALAAIGIAEEGTF